jgi:hypothetical protein
LQPTVWIDNGVTKVKQCWSRGAHSNVGGGYKDTGLANLALVWVIAQLDKYIFFDRIALLHFVSSLHKEKERVKEFSEKVAPRLQHRASA